MVTHPLSLLRNLPGPLPQKAAQHLLNQPKLPDMAVPHLKVPPNLHQLLLLVGSFLLPPQPRAAVHGDVQSGTNQDLTPPPVGWEGLAALPPLEGDVHGPGPLTRGAVLDPGPHSGVGHGLHSDGGDLEVPRDVAAPGLLNGLAGLEAEMLRDEEDLGQQQGEAGHALDPQLLGEDPDLEHQLGGEDLVPGHLPEGGLAPGHLPDGGLALELQPVVVGLVPEHLLDEGLVQDHQYDGDLAPGHQPGEVAGPVPEHQLDEVEGLVLGPQLDGVAGPVQGPLPGVVDPVLGPQQDEGDLVPEPQPDEGDLVLEPQSDVEDLILGRHRGGAGLAHHQNGKTSQEHPREEADLIPVQK